MHASVTIHPITGQISVVNPAALRLFPKLNIRAFDGLYQDTAVVKISLTQALDKSLQFDQDIYRARVTENTPHSNVLVILGVHGNQERLPAPLGLELQIAGNCHVGSSNWVQVL